MKKEAPATLTPADKAILEGDFKIGNEIAERVTQEAKS